MGQGWGAGLRRGYSRCFNTVVRVCKMRERSQLKSALPIALHRGECKIWAQSTGLLWGGVSQLGLGIREFNSLIRPN